MQNQRFPEATPSYMTFCEWEKGNTENRYKYNFLAAKENHENCTQNQTTDHELTIPLLIQLKNWGL